MKFTNSVLFLAFSIFTTQAQVVLQTGNLPVPGDNWTNKTITDTTIQPGYGGTGQNWNFSSFFVHPTVLGEQFTTPTGAGNDALFPSSNLKVTSLFGGNEYYYKTSNELQYLGLKNLTSEVIITNTQKLLTVPFQYGDSIVNPAVTGTGLGYPLSGTITVKADGEGSLTLFTGAFTNTLRVFTEMNLVLGAGTGVDTYVHIQRHAWYSSFYRAPVFMITSLNIDGPLGSSSQKVTTVSLLTTDIPEAPYASFNLFPNPSAGLVNIAMEGVSGKGVSLRISDLAGKTWKSEKLKEGAAIESVDISSLPRGVYIVSLINGAATREQRLVVE